LHNLLLSVPQQAVRNYEPSIKVVTYLGFDVWIVRLEQLCFLTCTLLGIANGVDGAMMSSHFIVNVFAANLRAGSLKSLRYTQGRRWTSSKNLQIIRPFSLCYL